MTDRDTENMKDGICDYADYHSELGECERCPKCGFVNHFFRDEPYCEWCGKPHEGYFEALKRSFGK